MMWRGLAAAAVAMGVAVAAQATQIVDTFSFTGTVRDPGGNPIASGAVTGTITFAGAGTGVAAQSIFITSSPAVAIGAGDTNANLTAVRSDGYLSANSFDVQADGTVTAYNFNNVTSYSNGTFLNLSLSGAELNARDTRYFISNYGANDLKFVSNLAAIPEPSSWAMMIVGTGMVGGALRRRRGVAASA